MSNFWDTSDGASAAATATTEYEISGGGVIVPDDSTVLAFIAKASWRKDDNFNEYIEIEWTVEKPEPVNGSKVWQKLWVKDHDPKAKSPEKAIAKRDKALRMLSTIDANAGGKLARAGREPSDDDLALALQTKQMAIKCKVWEMSGNSGNWVAAVFPKDKPLMLTEAVAPVPASGGFGGDLGDTEIPF